jgi:acyl carrier protein
MPRKQLESTLRTIIATIAETTPDFRAEADLKYDLGVDSHRMIELLFELERTFDIHIPDSRFPEMGTLKGLLALVESLRAAR